MTSQEAIAHIGFDRAKSILPNSPALLESEIIVFEQVKGFEIEAIYFNTDENDNSFPAVFLKKVIAFDKGTLEKIADIHQKIWNYKKVLFFYVYSETEIRIYNCSEKPVIKTQKNIDYAHELKNIQLSAYTFSDKEQLQELDKLFSRVAIDTGIIWTLEEAEVIRKKINLQRRVDKYLVESLINTANQLKAHGLDLQFIHKIILRSLFLLYLEDRGATDKKFYNEIKKGATSYFDILEDVEATQQLYQKLAEHFNGNVFSIDGEERLYIAGLRAIKKCFTIGNDGTNQPTLFENWRLFDFSIIQIELLSEIYENFLSKTDLKEKKKTGTFYTPPALVAFILNEKLPIHQTEKNYNVKVLDPSCGSGIFLVESFKRLVKRYENVENKELTDYDQLKKILLDNIFGVEISPQAIKVAAFSLYLALLDKLDPKILWQDKKHRLPNLINDPTDETLSEQGRNLFCRDTIVENAEIETIEFDLVVGNPPFGTKELSASISTYCNQEDFAKEMVLPFLHKATKFAPHGKIAMIFNTKVLTNTGGTYQNFRKWLFNDCHVEKVFNFSILRNVPKNFGGQLFGGATGPVSIVFYQKEIPETQPDKIVYYAPKTYIKSNVIDGLSIDFTDIKYLPRVECQKPDTKIWKIAMWGGMNDWELVNQMLNKLPISILSFLKQNKDYFNFGSGLHSPSKEQIANNKIFIPRKTIELRKVKKYYTLNTAYKFSEKVYRTINEKIFNPPYLLLKEGQKDKEFCASYLDYQSFHTAYSISAVHEAADTKLKLWCCLVNSSFAKYFLTLTSSSWGIERERVQANETLSLPALNDIDSQILEVLNNKFNLLVASLKNDQGAKKTKSAEKDIDDFMLESVLQLSKEDIFNIKDLIDYSIDLFDKKEKSIALYPVLQGQTTEYAEIICSELNNFLEGEDGLYINATVYNNISRTTPLMMVKISFAKKQENTFVSNELVNDELKKIDQHLWEKKAPNIYFRKKLNFKTGDDIYIIRPNQRRFWSKSMAVEDASELILEILTGK